MPKSDTTRKVVLPKPQAHEVKAQVHASVLISATTEALKSNSPEFQEWEIEKLERACIAARLRLAELGHRISCPEMVVKVYLVDHGYQIDFLSDKGEDLGSECRDFGGNYPPNKMREVIEAGFMNVMHKAELVYKSMMQVKKIKKNNK